MSNFYKHIFRSSRLQMLLKISAPKNFAILSIKKRLQHSCFRVRSSYMMLAYWQIFSQNTYHGVRTIAPEEKCSRLGLEFGLGLALKLGLEGGNFPRGQLSQNSYHQLHSSYEDGKVFKNSFFIERLQKQSFAHVLQNRCSKKFWKLYRKALELESLFKKLAG